MIGLNKLLKCQAIYCLVGILFNVVSYVLIYKGEQGLTPTIPLQGIIIMLLFGFFLLTGYFRKLRWYRLLMLFSIILFGYGGIIKHFFALQQTPELYNSFFSGIVGIGINIFGLVLNVLAVLGKYDKNNTIR